MLDFRCPDCGADLSKQAEAAAWKWSKGLPESCGAWCDTCEADVFFRLVWQYVLLSATPIKEREPEIAEPR